ncbi:MULTISPECIES: nucleoside-diphosphate kinase [Paenibacillus]|jgi:nucleoside-diphosphate kinase|uniref:Nucleoside diphosphate kinase n=1 Tax=Paenibacillus allorhizoplanae TaxID=2905648 RepID=A0ABN8G7W7_9BACL|nr:MULTISPECIES: nucleoside-diphosphate kinase [Paenibacillus]KRE98200.1 nucleoside diphosphate kinase [Paenibacillus sp. Soil766]NQX59014.1 nucleoside-diphosphate kinase [Paenibacillus qinlingensis]CAH1197208.1 Nucleoside diphosphate kinase [Paenibacillus allorhizoplanae]
MEKTFLMVKPDGVQRGLVGEIVKRFEQKGFQLIGSKLTVISREQAEIHYAEHKGKDFFERLVNFITSGPVFAMVWHGDQVITLSRTMIGKTNSLEAAPGTIRGDYAVHTNLNLIHGSDSPESAEREINNFFQPNEIFTYSKNIQEWI